MYAIRTASGKWLTTVVTTGIDGPATGIGTTEDRESAKKFRWGWWARRADFAKALTSVVNVCIGHGAKTFEFIEG